MLQLYDQLLQFPLFQGMSHDDLERVAGHTRFGFVKIQAGQRIVADGDPSTHLHFLISGTLKAETSSADHAYTVEERIQAPYLLQPEAIFGYQQRFTHTFTAFTHTSLITIDKSEVVRLSEEFLVFRLNLLGLIATQSQKLAANPWRRPPGTLESRIVRFFVSHCLYPAGPKTFRILMNRLADELNDSRLDISRALNRMQQNSLITLHRGRIEIPSLERLLM
jgi:CRP-like cAMP-binding protein